MTPELATSPSTLDSNHVQTPHVGQQQPSYWWSNNTDNIQYAQNHEQPIQQPYGYGNDNQSQGYEPLPYAEQGQLGHNPGPYYLQHSIESRDVTHTEPNQYNHPVTQGNIPHAGDQTSFAELLEEYTHNVEDSGKYPVEEFDGDNDSRYAHL